MASGETSVLSSMSQKTESARSLPATVTVGRVRRPHGVRGELLVEVTSDLPDRFQVGSVLFLVSTDGDRQQVQIEKSRSHRLGAIIGLESCRSRDHAEVLRGSIFEVERGSVPNAPNGCFYYFELVGCTCRDLGKGNLGTVTDILEDGGGLLLRVRDGDQEVLIPFVAKFISEIDISNGMIEVDLPEGLIETCTSV